jgi:hypothetical protein
MGGSGFARFRQYGWELDGEHFLMREDVNGGPGEAT